MKTRIIVNIGHGGIGKYYDSGCIFADETQEHVFNLNELYPLVKKELEKLNFEVIPIIQQKSFGELSNRLKLPGLKARGFLLQFHSRRY